MTKKFSYILVVFGFLGFLTLIPGFVDGVIYYYFRVVSGHSMEFKNQCFSVPKGWVIDSIPNRTKRRVYSLRSKDSEKYYFASVIYGKASIVPGIKKLEPIKIEGDLFRVYELANLADQNTVRYWSVVPAQNLIIMGRDISVLESLSLAIHSVDC